MEQKKYIMVGTDKVYLFAISKDLRELMNKKWEQVYKRDAIASIIAKLQDELRETNEALTKICYAEDALVKNMDAISDIAKKSIAGQESKNEEVDTQ